MTPPPLPPGCSGYPVAPNIHTGLPEPERDGWTQPEPADFDEHCDTTPGLIDHTQPEATP